MSAPDPSSDLGFAHRFVPALESSGGAATLLLLHGTGGSESDLLSLGAQLLPGAALLSPRGQVLEAGAPRFFRRLAEGVFDVEDLKARTHDLAAFVARAADSYSFDASRVIAVGFSNGANIAASLLLLRPQVLAGAILLRPMVPLVPDELPDLAGKPILIAAGRRDPLVPVAETERLASLLSACGASVELAWQDSGHGLTPGDIAHAQSWIELDRSGQDRLKYLRTP